jgi:hypothetical protein
MNAHGDDRSQIEELHRVMHVQTEVISELNSRMQVLEKKVAVSMEVQKEALENAKQTTKTLQREIDALSSRLLKIK